MLRRHFLATIPAGLAVSRRLFAAEAEAHVYLNEPIGKINPWVHGHFIEHLGGVIYDGVWVGENSKIPNSGGIRNALVEAMKPLGSTVMRWPGGCFADSYDWRDGVGSRSSRPSKTNFWADSGRLRDVPPSNPAVNDPNHFGTNEFIRFCRLIDAEPYFAANLRSLPARDFYEWVEYCNAPAGSNSLAARRAAGGDTEPFNVRFWGVGNESWGCGGEMTAAEYSQEFRKFIAWVPRYQKPISFIAAGPNGGDLKWSREFFRTMAEKSPCLLDRVWGWALHYYCGTTGKGDSVDFTPEDAYELLNRADRMESLIDQHWSVMGEVDREHRVKLVVDEWGAWHRDGTAVAPHHLFGSVQTMRDALISGLTLDTFHRHADKIEMANVAQLVNCIQTLFLAHEDKFCVTPVYHVFSMYKAHKGGEAVRTQLSAPRIDYTYDSNSRNVVRFAGSASHSGGKATFTAVNLSLTDPLTTSVHLHGVAIKEARAAVLSAEDIHAHNDFARPEAVKPQAAKVETAGNTVRLTFPPCSVVKIEAQV
jgi:alpha-N-arabinofuranosidase